MPELRAAVVGAGRLGALHAHKYASLPGVKLRYVVDIDASRARAQFGWAPRWTTAEAVARTAVWYRERAVGAPARALIERDLEAHAAA